MWNKLEILSHSYCVTLSFLQIHTQLNRIKQQQQQMQQRQMQQQKQQQQQQQQLPLPQPQKKKAKRAARSQAKVKESSDDDWKCECGNVMGGSRARCGKCRRWKGGKREKKWKNSAGETNASLRATSSNSSRTTQCFLLRLVEAILKPMMTSRTWW